MYEYIVKITDKCMKGILLYYKNNIHTAALIDKNQWTLTTPNPNSTPLNTW